MSKIKNIIDIVKFKDVNIIGSAADFNLKYFSDLDLQEKVSGYNNIDFLVRWFQRTIKKLKNHKDVYFQELKAGVLNNQPIKWTYKEVQQGFKIINDEEFPLKKIFNQQSIIKMDFIIFQSNTFIEVSINYYFIFTGGNQTFSALGKEEIANALLFEYNKLKGEDFYKALKRLYSFYKLTDDKKVLVDMRRLFNSKLGFLNKQLSNLKTIRQIIKDGPNDLDFKNKVISSIKKIFSNLEKFNKYNMKDSPINYKGSLENIALDLDKLIENFSLILDVDVKNFIDKSNFNYFLK